MKNSLYFSLITASILLINPSLAAFSQTLKNPSLPLTIAQDNPNNVQQIAKEITVKVLIGDTNGSGVIIAKEGKTYTVITNAHVVRRSSSYRIQTADGKVYPASLKQQGESIEGNDLAVLEFQSENNYRVATLGNSATLKENDTVFSAGFSSEGENFIIISGKITFVSPKPLKGGYQIGYSNDTQQGMSGGPLLDTEGNLIGIVGMAKGAILDEAYTYLDNTRPSQDTISQWRGYSFAVPVANISNISQQVAQSPNNPKYTGIPKQVDEIAEQVTVRIDASDGSNGSGVIIAKDKNRYYILTAKHVVNNNTQNLKLITPDGQEHPLNQSDIELIKEVDLAVISFESPQNYAVATLAKYQVTFNLSNVIFTSGFPKAKSGKFQRKFTAGQLVPTAFSQLVSKDDYSLSDGYQLTYTNVSYGGMSGGPILDQYGQVIGINGAAENDLVYNATGERIEIPMGLSLGIPINTFLISIKQTSIQPNILNVIRRIPPDVSDKDRELILSQVSALEVPSANADVVDWLQYGGLLLRLGRNQDAQNALNKAIQLDPNSYQAYYLRSFTYSGLMTTSEEQEKEKEKRNAEASIADLYQTTKLDPKFETAWRFLAISLMNQKKYEEALKVSDEAIKLTPDSPKGYLTKALVLSNSGKYQEALDSINKSIEIEPSFLGYLMRANAYTALKDKKAIADFDKAIELNPSFTVGYIAKAELFISLGDNQSVLKEINKLKQITDDPNIIGAIDLLQLSLQISSVENYTAKFSKILNETDKILKLDINNDNVLAMAYLFRAASYIGNKDNAKALIEFDKLFKLKVDNPSLLNVAQFYKLKLLSSSVDDMSIQEKIESASKLIDLIEDISLQKSKETDNNVLNLMDFPDKLIVNSSANSLLENIPPLSNAYNNRGNVYSDQQKWDLALADFSKAIELDPKSAVFYSNRGYVYINQQKWDLALADFSKAIELDPKNAVFYNLRGNFYSNQKKWDLALADYSKAIELDPKNAVSYSNRGYVYDKQKKWDLALADFSKAIELDPKNADYYDNRGNVYRKQKKWDLALADFSKAIELDPKNDFYYYRRGNVYSDQQKWDLALADYSKAIELDPKYASAYYRRGNVYREQKKWDLALADYSKAIELDPKNDFYYYRRGNVYSDQQKWDLALADFSKAIELDPKYADYYSIRGNLYIQIENKQAAIKDLQKAAQLYQEEGNTEDYKEVMEMLRKLGV